MPTKSLLTQIQHGLSLPKRMVIQRMVRSLSNNHQMMKMKRMKTALTQKTLTQMSQMQKAIAHTVALMNSLTVNCQMDNIKMQNYSSLNLLLQCFLDLWSLWNLGWQLLRSLQCQKEMKVALAKIGVEQFLHQVLGICQKVSVACASCIFYFNFTSSVCSNVCCRSIPI